VATGLLYGVRVDTQEFRREVSPEDFEAAAYLLPWVDDAALERVESPSMNADTLETVGRAVRNREVRGSVLTSCVGAVRDRDTLAQAADRLLEMEGVTTALVYGTLDGMIYVSGRARGTDLDVGATVRDAFGQIGEAGGHADMAGAQIPLGVLGDLEDDGPELSSVVRDVVTDRFFETVRSRPGASPGRYGTDDGDGTPGDAVGEAGEDGSDSDGSESEPESDSEPDSDTDASESDSDSDAGVASPDED
jgi:nanoRNase/pAp phosphatase (c-di-AMP/oligoRNAs hydrolase)